MREPSNRTGHDGHALLQTFVGRSGELRRLRTAAEEARAGLASLVLVRGSAGIGKTALVRRFLAGLKEFTVLSAVATPTASEAAFGCLNRLLRPTVVAAEFRHRPGVEFGPAGTRPIPEDGGPHALRRLLDSPAVGPVAVFLDDAQWADGATLRALAEAVHTGGRLCVVLAVRRSHAWDDETQRTLQLTHPAGTVDLREFTEAEAADLVAASLGDAAGRTLTRHLLLRSGHHPLYLSALAAQQATAAPADPSSTPCLPTAVARRQLRGLPRATADALEALAVLGGSAPVAVLERVIGEPDCTSVLDPLVHEGFVTTASVPVPTATITHASFRDALYQDMPLARRRALHLVAASAVDWRQRSAHRLAAAERVDARLVADVIEVVEQEISDGHLLTAARMLAAAARPSDDDPLADHLLYGAVRLLFWAGADAELCRYSATVATRRPSPWRDEALGLTEFAAGRLTSARRLLDRAQALLPAGVPRQRAVISTELAMTLAILGQGEATRRHAEQALEWLHSNTTDLTGDDGNDMAHAAAPARAPCGSQGPVVPPEPGRAAHALVAYGAALHHGARTGLALLAALPEDADEIGEEDVPALTVRGILRLADGRIAAATTDLSIAVVRSRRGGPRLLGASSALHLATCLLLSGDWNRAIRQIHLALEDAQSRRLDIAALWSLRSVLDAFRGNEADAAACLSEAQELARQLDFGGPQYHTAVARALGARARGDHRGVVAALQILAEHSDHSDRVRVVTTSWVPFLTESLIVCGHPEYARAAMTGLKAVSDESNFLVDIAEKWLCGRLAEAAGDGADAVTRYGEALDALAPGRDIPLLRGLLETSLGRATAALGDMQAAAGHFASAEGVYVQLGARALLTEYRAQRRAALPSPDRMPGQESLTERERQVTHLVTQGHTNQEIADELTLSVKTIEYHLRNVFGKLGVHNRRELRRRIRAVGR
ncbi:LuxR C-terminal-related transcriptional regulator [Streptomyces sp. NPDC001288]|uniref:helix-turn-helix transcriptional regulator n=1 Tax=unclassified Streptomyces TaxID=2593676 RepID=UPI00331683EF